MRPILATGVGDVDLARLNVRASENRAPKPSHCCEKAGDAAPGDVI